MIENIFGSTLKGKNAVNLFSEKKESVLHCLLLVIMLLSQSSIVSCLSQGILAGFSVSASVKAA